MNMVNKTRIFYFKLEMTETQNVNVVMFEIWNFNNASPNVNTSNYIVIVYKIYILINFSNTLSQYLMINITWIKVFNRTTHAKFVYRQLARLSFEFWKFGIKQQTADQWPACSQLTVPRLAQSLGVRRFSERFLDLWCRLLLLLLYRLHGLYGLRYGLHASESVLYSLLEDQLLALDVLKHLYELFLLLEQRIPESRVLRPGLERLLHLLQLHLNLILLKLQLLLFELFGENVRKERPLLLLLLGPDRYSGQQQDQR